MRKPGNISVLTAALIISAMLSAPALAALYTSESGTAVPEPEPTAATDSVSGESITAETSDEISEPAADIVSVYDVISGELLSLELEDYIAGVTAAEMPVSFGAEALKAQAVAARSYAVYLLSSRTCDESHHGAQLCTDSSHCKAYTTYEALAERWGSETAGTVFKEVRAAVTATEGEILTYDGNAALTVFHSSSDGLTESAASVWGGELPYLISVETPENIQPVIVSFTPDELNEKLAPHGASVVGGLPDIIYDDAGRAASVIFGDVTLTGSELRTALGLRSTAFRLILLDGEYIFTVRGYGHGVGMSQYGAAAMAESGADYIAILAHYYPGTVLGSK